MLATAVPTTDLFNHWLPRLLAHYTTCHEDMIAFRPGPITSRAASSYPQGLRILGAGGADAAVCPTGCKVFGLSKYVCYRELVAV